VFLNLMRLDAIIDSIRSGRINITYHARQEAKNDSLLLDDILNATENGEVIEDYPTDQPYPSCLIYGESEKGDPIHCVWAHDTKTKISVLITVYRPNPKLWIDWKERKRLS